MKKVKVFRVVLKDEVLLEEEDHMEINMLKEKLVQLVLVLHQVKYEKEKKCQEEWDQIKKQLEGW